MIWLEIDTTGKAEDTTLPLQTAANMTAVSAIPPVYQSLPAQHRPPMRFNSYTFHNYATAAGSNMKGLNSLILHPGTEVQIK